MTYSEELHERCVQHANDNSAMKFFHSLDVCRRYIALFDESQSIDKFTAIENAQKQIEDIVLRYARINGIEV